MIVCIMNLQSKSVKITEFLINADYFCEVNNYLLVSWMIVFSVNKIYFYYVYMMCKNKSKVKHKLPKKSMIQLFQVSIIGGSALEQNY